MPIPNPSKTPLITTERAEMIKPKLIILKHVLPKAMVSELSVNKSINL